MTYDDVGKGGRAGQASDAPGEELGMGSFDIGDIAGPASEAPSFKPEELEPYRSGGYELIPLHTPKALDRNGRQLGKAPFKGWMADAPISVEDAQAHMADGSNVGVRLRPCDLVVDVDPRNFADGDDPLARLAADLDIDFSDYPTVVTGSGGKHIYMLKPEHDLLRDTVEGYDGIEFKAHGRQVVAPGSVHPNGGTYLWDDDILATPLAAVAAAPAALIDLARRPAPTGSTDAGDFDAEHPIQLHIWLGGRPHHFHSELEQEIHHTLAHLGYTQESDLEDPLLGTVWVRSERWLEDTYWHDLIAHGREAMIARLMAELN
jgi:hypothetical protein